MYVNSMKTNASFLAFLITKLTNLRVREKNQYKNVDNLKSYLSIIQNDNTFNDEKKCR